jgi:hypothetical protein
VTKNEEENFALVIESTGCKVFSTVAGRSISDHLRLYRAVLRYGDVENSSLVSAHRVACCCFLSGAREEILSRLLAAVRFLAGL